MGSYVSVPEDLYASNRETFDVKRNADSGYVANRLKEMKRRPASVATCLAMN